jgi:hypothetical protein
MAFHRRSCHPSYPTQLAGGPAATQAVRGYGMWLNRWHSDSYSTWTVPLSPFPQGGACHQGVARFRGALVCMSARPASEWRGRAAATARCCQELPFWQDTRCHRRTGSGRHSFPSAGGCEGGSGNEPSRTAIPTKHLRRIRFVSLLSSPPWQGGGRGCGLPGRLVTPCHHGRGQGAVEGRRPAMDLPCRRAARPRGVTAARLPAPAAGRRPVPPGSVTPCTMAETRW